MEPNIPNTKTFVLPKGPITLLMTKNGPIMIITNNNQFPAHTVPSESQQIRENIFRAGVTHFRPKAVTDKPLSEAVVTKEQTNVNKVGAKEVVNILTAAQTERSKSTRAKRLIDNLQQIETTGNEKSNVITKDSGIQWVKKIYQHPEQESRLDVTGNILTAAETERSKSMRAKILIDSLQQIETTGNENSNVITKESGIQWVKRTYQDPDQESRLDVTVKEPENDTKEKINLNIIGSQSGFQNKNKSYSCHKCGQKFEKIDSMMKHFAIHRNEKLSTPSAKRIRTSPKKSNKSAKNKQPKNELNCSECEYKCKEFESMEIHMKIHADVIEKPFSCDTCGERFTINSELMEHIKTHTGEKFFSCSTCERKFTQKHSLLSHLLSHTGEKPFSCSICEKKFFSESNRNKHKVKHVEGENNCPICSKTFKTVSAKKKHIKVHDNENEEGKYICGICEMAFHNKSKLLHHLSQHNESDEPVDVYEESFLCPYCEEIFIHRDDLIQHFEAVHI